jgi:hypothetical protein
MFVLLQVYPPEAIAEDDDFCCCLDVIAVHSSRTKLEQFLTGYETRYRAAVAAFNLWDDMSKEEWGDEHDAKMDELSDEYQVFGSLIPETRFEILETRTSSRPPWHPRRTIDGIDDASPAA